MDKKNIVDVLALTPMQEGMLFHYLKDPNSNYYFEQLTLKISGKIQLEYFKQAWNFVIETNEMLRAVFRWEKIENPIQIILKKHHFQPIFYDLSTKQENEKHTFLAKIKLHDSKSKFNLQEVPFRVMLCRIKKDWYEMIISNHHIIYDGWSNGIILKEFFNAYNDLSSGKKLVKPLKTKFKEFVKWIRERNIDEQKFWNNYLEGADTQTGLSVKRRRKGREITGTEKVQLRLARDVKDEIEIFVKKLKVTLASFLYTTWGLLLQKYNNSNDAIFGTTISGRTAEIKGIEDIVGLFINTLPLRVQSNPHEKMGHFLQRIDKAVQIRKGYETTSLVNIKESSKTNNKDELFDSIVLIENYPLDSNLMQGKNKLSVDSYSMVEKTHYDLTIAIIIRHDIEITFTFNKELFDQETILRISHHFKGIIKDFTANPGKKIARVEIISAEEKNEILYKFNNTNTGYPKNKNIIQLFEDQVDQVPDHAALVGKNENAFGRMELTYRELYKKTNQLAGCLQKKGVGPNTIVGIMMERSIEMIIGIMAILKAGSAYLPLDPEYPEERKQYMLKDSDAKILLAASDFTYASEPSSSALNSTLTCQVSPANLAYIIYTSGSTGKPKGVMVEQPSVVNILWALQNKYPLKESDAYLFKTSVVFDVSVAELFGWFLAGGRLAILGKGGEKDPEKILDTIRHHNITHINFVPSMFNAFLEILNSNNIHHLSSLKYIFLAGEALLPYLVKRFKHLKSDAALENIYGPTENTIYASSYSLSAWQENDNIPIGKPLNNVLLYILDRYDHLQPFGVPGELCISGSGLARGYLNRPELTAESFCLWQPGGSFCKNRPLAPHKNFFLFPLNIYKTGDLARWLADGYIEYLGRMDDQVKVRGFRVELGEIESRLLSHPLVKEAVVVAHEDGAGDKNLCAYILSNAEPGSGAGSSMASTLKRYLYRWLPEYMIPFHFVSVEEIPLTPSGKVNHRALPKPEISAAKEYSPPRHEREALLVEIWADVLGIKKEIIGIDHNFFELGGHSIKATRLMGRIHQRCQVSIPLSELFKQPTIRSLSQYIEHKESHSYASIPFVEEKEYYPLSPVQERFYVFQRMAPEETSYNISEVMLVEGHILTGNFLEIFKKLIQRHESLRTSFLMLKGEPVQRVHKEVEFKIEFYEQNIGGTIPPVSSTITQLAASLIEHFVLPFDLSKAPLVRLGFLNIGPETHLLAFDMHHIISDGVSMGIFTREFLSLQKGEALPVQRIQYKEYVCWLEKNWQKDIGKRKYGPTTTSAEEDMLNLPTDYVRPAVPGYDGKIVHFVLEPSWKAALLSLALQHEVTLYMVLLSIFNIFLAKLSGQENIVIGSPIAGRLHNDLENIIGLFINTLVLRNFPSGEKPFVDFLGEVTTHALEAFDHQDYQYEELVDKIISTRESGHNPLYDVMFVFQNMEIPPLDIPGLKVTREVGENQTAKFDLTLYFVEWDQRQFKLEYNTDLFKPETIRRFIGYFKMVIAQVLADPQRKISGIEIITGEERQQILVDFNDSGVSFPTHRMVYQVFEEWAARIPDNIAVRFRQPDTGQQDVTYGQLNERSNQLAGLLRDYGLKANVPTGIMMERGVDTLVAILAVMKAGAVYMPIDPEYPENRITWILENSGAPLLLTQTRIVEQKSFASLTKNQRLLQMDILDSQWERYSRENPEPVCGPGDLIYIIFTSGSTGKPKGAGVYHRGFMNLMHWFIMEFALDANDRNMMVTSPSFDLTQKNFYTSLMTGGVLCFPCFTYFEPRALMGEIYDYELSWINCTPSMFYKLVEYEMAGAEKCLSGLRYVFLGGEPIIMNMLIDWLQSEDCIAEIVNTYGPTECTDISNFYRIKEPVRFLTETIPIGKPIYNVQLYILDENLHPLPIGVVGELLIGGASVGIGYVNDRELTRQKFIRHSFLPDGPEHLLYRTGDLVKWQDDGNVEFVGRVDHQVKVRGFRIELEEIEILLQAHEGVKEAVVIVRPGQREDKYLCAYVVPHQSGTLAVDRLRNYLVSHLPDYMVPSYFVLLEKFPLNPHGKVDRHALPDPDTSIVNDYTPPGNEIEKKLVDIWSEVLNMDRSRIGIHHNFFRLGGHSLKAASLIGKIHKMFSVEISIARLFKSPTIKEICRYIQETSQGIYASPGLAEKKEYYITSSTQKRLYFLYQMAKTSTAYNMPFAWILQGLVEKDNLEQAFKTLIQRHESLRTSFEILADEPVQKVYDNVEFAIQYDHRTGNVNPLQPGEPVIDNSLIRPFDLKQAPLLRVALIRVEERKHILIIDMHHIICDGRSIEILAKDFISISAGEKLPPLKLQYKDFSEWKNRQKEKGNIKQQGEYWIKDFAGEIPTLNLPIDFSRSAEQSFAGSTLKFTLGTEETIKLKSLAMAHDSTLFMVLFALFNVLLVKLSGQEEFVVGCPVVGRRHTELEDIIGVFVNTLALRNYPCGEKSFHEFLGELKGKTLAAFENQDYPFEDLVERLGVTRDVTRNPLFDVMFVMQDMEIPELSIPGLNLKPYPHEFNISKFDMTFICEPWENDLFCIVEYRTKLFKQDTIKRFISYFKKIASEMTGNRNRDITIGEVEITSEKEKRELLHCFNNFEPEMVRDKRMEQLFREQVSQTPDYTALVRDDIHITYQELNEQSNRLCHYLFRQGVNEKGKMVGIRVERSLEMIIGILAILKADGAYVPINPKLPASRYGYILQECNIKVILTQSHLLGKNPYSDGSCYVCLDESGNYPGITGRGVEKEKDPGDLAYVIFTSGSTGIPKGVPITHANLSPLLHWGYCHLGLGTKDRVLQNLPYYFDWSVWEIFITLTTGASLYSVPDDRLLNPELCIDLINARAVTVLHITPTQYQYMANISAKPRTLKYLFIGAEKLSYDLVKRSFTSVSRDCRVFNMYGPTEATIISAVLEIDPAGYHRFKELSSIPIGQPVGNTILLILDHYLNLCPVNITGNLYIAGDALAAGYLNDPEKSSGSFTRNIYKADGMRGERMYKTGDLSRWLADGNIEYLGRIDHQVKIRGFRIEPGEIENHLLKHEKVKEAVIICRKNEKEEQYLCAYIVAAAPLENPQHQLRRYLAEKLPDYMIPANFVILENIPLNPNGKIDLEALPEPEWWDNGENFIPLENKVEEILAGIWSDILSVEKERIHRESNYFQLGGHSLRAIMMVSRIHKTFQVKVPLEEIFVQPTVSELANYIKSAVPEQFTLIDLAEEQLYYPVSSVQKRLYFLQQLDPGNKSYNISEVVRLEGIIDIRRFEETFKRLIKRHESLRTSFQLLAGEPVQKIDEQVEFEIEYYDAENNTPDPGSEASIIKNFIRPFDLSQPPLLRVGLIKLEETKHLLMIDMHHIISDGTSFLIFIKDFMTFYKGEEPPELLYQYKDYSKWQSSQEQKNAMQIQEEYWLETLKGEIPLLNLPTDYPRPQLSTFTGSVVNFEIGREETQALRNLVLEEEVTLFIVLLSLYNILLHKLSGQEEIIVGTSAAGRRHQSLQDIIGMFVNAVVLRNFPIGFKTFKDLLKEVKKTTLAAFENQDYQYENLVEKLEVKREPGRNPIFSVMFVLNNEEEPEIAIPGLKLIPYGYTPEAAQMDLKLRAKEGKHKILFTFEYSTDLFKKETIEMFIENFKEIAAAVKENENIKLNNIRITHGLSPAKADIPETEFVF